MQCNAMQCHGDRSRVLLALQRTDLGRNRRAFGRFFPGCNAKAQCLVWVKGCSGCTREEQAD